MCKGLALIPSAFNNLAKTCASSVFPEPDSPDIATIYLSFYFAITFLKIDLAAVWCFSVINNTSPNILFNLKI